MAAAREPMNVTFHGSPTAATAQLHSPWHSPVPYLFGGLAAMLGLIAFALLILACSYWKLSGYLEGGEGEGERDLEAGEGGKDENLKSPVPLEEKILVIMAGQAKPTYLATPMSSRSSSFGDTNSSSSSGSCSNCGAGRSEKVAKMTEMEKQVCVEDHQVQSQSRVQQQTDEDHQTQTQTH